MELKTDSPFPYKLPRTPWMAVLFVVLLAVILRVPLLNATGFWIDEVLTLRGCKMQGTQLHQNLARYENAKPPLYWHIMGAWVGGRNPSEISETYFRLPGVIFGALACGIMVLLGTAMVNRTTGLFAGILLAISPFHIWHCVDARPFVLMHLFVAVSALGFVRYIKTSSWLDLGIFTVGLALACWSFSYAVLFGMVTFLIVAVLWKQLHARRLALPLVGAHIVAALAFLPWVLVIADIYLVKKNGALANYESSAIESIAMATFAVPYGFSMGPSLGDLATHRLNIFKAFPNDSMVAAAAGLVFVAMFAAKLLDKTRRMDKLDWILLGSMVLLILLPAIPTILNKQVPYNPRYAMSALVPAFLFMAKLGASSMSKGRRGLAGGLCALVTVLMLLATCNLHFQKRYWREDLREAAALAVRNQDKIDALIVCSGQFSLPAWLHYQRQGGNMLKAMAAANATDPETNRDQQGNPFQGPVLDPVSGLSIQPPVPLMLKHADTYFLIYGRPERGDPQGIIPKWLEEHAQILAEWPDVRGAQCYLFKRK